MSVNVNDKSGLVESFTPGYEGCGCGNRRYYTKAEIDEMFRNVLDPEQIEKIVKEVVDEYVTSEEFSQVIISIIGEDYYTKAQIGTILEGYATKAWTTGDTDSRISTAMASETARTEDVYAKKTDVPSLDGYATTGWVDSQNYLKDITITINGDEVHNGSEIIIEGGGGEPVDISGKLDTTAFTQAMENETARTESTYAKKTDIPSLEGYATTGWVENQGYLTNADLSGKVDTSAFTAYTATTKQCCDYVKSEIRDIWAVIATLTGDTPTPPGPEPTGSTGNGYVKIVYDVQSTSTPVKLFDRGADGITSAKLEDDTPIEYWNVGGMHTFDETGITPVYYSLNNKYLTYMMFSNCPDIVYVELISGFTGWDINTYYNSETNCFEGCTSLTGATIDGDVKHLPNALFKGCSALSDVDLPSTVEIMGTEIFSGCTSLSSITVRATTAPTIPNNPIQPGEYHVFAGVPSSGTLYRPIGSDYTSWFNDVYALPTTWSNQSIPNN